MTINVTEQQEQLSAEHKGATEDDCKGDRRNDGRDEHCPRFGGHSRDEVGRPWGQHNERDQRRDKYQ